ncbi:MAG: hypothetical protein FVQ81_02295 [Candidatus Glassbacteria bacterium]|nr:hypothetical protein [Candidatus Glassbacteria bacterium]
MRALQIIAVFPVLYAVVFTPGLRAQSTWYSAYETALEDIAAGRWEQSVEHLRQALEIKPDPELNARTYGVWRRDYLPFYHLGLSFFNMGEYKLSTEHFDRSLAAGMVERQPELLKQLSSYRQAALDRTAGAGPDREMARRIEEEFNRGLQLERQGSLDEALVKFESVLTLDPGNALATEHMLEIREKIAAHDSLLAREQLIAELMDSGYGHLEGGRDEEALEYFRRVVRFDPANPRALALSDSLGSIIAGIAEQRQRLDMLVRQLIEQGRSALAGGALEQAHRQFSRASSLDPENRSAARLTARTDSLLNSRRDSQRQELLLAEAIRLIEHDSLLAARDSLASARLLGPDSRADSLYAAIEQRIAERFLLRDIPQLLVSGRADSVIRLRSEVYDVSGSAFDDDGIVRIVIEINGEVSDLFRHSGGGQAPVRRTFERQIELAAGVNHLKLTVFDGHGKSFAASRTLVYSPPFWKLPLFLYLVALTVLLTAAGYYYFKRNTFHLLYNKLRRRPFVLISPNPYIVGNPIRSREMFFGREDDFRFVKNKVDNEKYGSLIVLFGERRAGKTSVLYQILGGRLGPRFVPVFLDMQAMAINNDSEFLGRVAEITADRIGARLANVDLSAFDDPSRNPYPLFEKFIDRTLEALGEDHLLFLVDEYELIEDKVAENKIRKEIFHFLSGLVEHKPGLFLIFAGNHRLQESRHSFWEPLLQRCDYRNISYLTPNDTRRLIQEPVRGKVFFIGTTVRDIMRLTAGQPFYTQLFCRSMVELLNAERRNFFYEEDISVVVREIIDNPPPQLIYFWAGMDPVEKLVLSTVAEVSRHAGSFPDPGEMLSAMKKYSASLPEDELKKICELMSVREILERGPKESYRFRMDLYRLWIREEHHLYSVAREFDRETITR